MPRASLRTVGRWCGLARMSHSQALPRGQVQSESQWLEFATAGRLRKHEQCVMYVYIYTQGAGGENCMQMDGAVLNWLGPLTAFGVNYHYLTVAAA